MGLGLAARCVSGFEVDVLGAVLVGGDAAILLRGARLLLGRFPFFFATAFASTSLGVREHLGVVVRGLDGDLDLVHAPDLALGRLGLPGALGVAGFAYVPCFES